MKTPTRILFTVLLCVILAGCISVETTVKLNRDGSGQIVEKMGVTKGMASAMSGGAAEGEGPQMFSKEQFEKGARDFGLGVRLVSASENEYQHMKYYEMVYAFDDINKVGIDQNQGNRVPSSGDRSAKKKEETVSFSFHAGEDYSTLKIRMPEADTGGSTQESPDKGDMSPEMEEAELQMMKMMFRGMHFAIKIEFNGDIVDTNATNVEGNTVTLLDIDFDKIMNNPEKLKELNKKGPEGIEEAKEILKDIEGLKFEFERDIMVKFE